MTYIISITQRKEVVKDESSYGRLKEEYISAKDYEKLLFTEQRDWKAVENNQYMRVVYGQLPPVRTIKVEEVEVFKQVKASLDVEALASYINQQNVKCDSTSKIELRIPRDETI